jgi:hypothetical protein
VLGIGLEKIKYLMQKARKRWVPGPKIEKWVQKVGATAGGKISGGQLGRAPSG